MSAKDSYKVVKRNVEQVVVKEVEEYACVHCDVVCGDHYMIRQHYLDCHCVAQQIKLDEERTLLRFEDGALLNEWCVYNGFLFAAIHPGWYVWTRYEDRGRRDELSDISAYICHKRDKMKEMQGDISKLKKLTGHCEEDE